MKRINTLIEKDEYAQIIDATVCSFTFLKGSSNVSITLPVSKNIIYKLCRTCVDVV